MNRKDFIRNQTELTRALTKRILNDAPDDIWYQIPAVINTNIAWQVGHLTISQFFHSISVISGFNEEIKEAIPLRLYAQQFHLGLDPKQEWELKPTASEFKENLDKVHQIGLKVLEDLPEYQLDQPLEPTKFKHPIATTKWEALNWNYRHESWHTGQINMIKRALGSPTMFF